MWKYSEYLYDFPSHTNKDTLQPGVFLFWGGVEI